VCTLSTPGAYPGTIRRAGRDELFEGPADAGDAADSVFDVPAEPAQGTGDHPGNALDEACDGLYDLSLEVAPETGPHAGRLGADESRQAAEPVADLARLRAEPAVNAVPHARGVGTDVCGMPPIQRSMGCTTLVSNQCQAEENQPGSCR